MLVRIDEITAEGRHFGEGVPKVRLDGLLTEEKTGFHALSEVDVDLRLSRAGKRILVEGGLDTRVGGACSRCLEQVEMTLPTRFRVDLRPGEDRAPEGLPGSDDESLGDGDADGSFSLEEADRDYYDGESLDIWPILREQLLLSLPDYPLCDEACKGLCQVCGADLNAGECGCDRKVPDPRFAALAKMKIT
jgi:uncharacterized protein